MYPYIKFFEIEIPTYGVCIACAVILTILLAIRDAKGKGICAEDVMIVGALSIGFALFGAKLLYVVVTYTWQDICSLVRKGNYSFLSGSGLVFLGGLLTGLLGAVFGAGIVRRKLQEFEECIVPYIPMGHAIGRVGCFLAGCCYGRPYTGPFAIYYIENGTGYFPIQLLEALCNLVICGILYKMARNQRQRYELLEFYLCLYALVRFALEFLRGDVERGGYLHLSTAQWMCAGIIMILFIKYIFKKGQKKHEEKKY